MVGSVRHNGLNLSLSTAGPDADIHVVRVDGVVDTTTSPELDALIGLLVGQNRFRIVVDLAGTEYISSAGWGIFISRLREIRDSGGDLKLARMSADVRGVFDLLEFEGILPRFDRLEAAQASFNGGNGHRVAPDSAPVAGTPLSTFTRQAAPAASLPEGDTALETAILRLVIEDPFYRLAEIKERLGELGYRKVGRWTIIQCLRRNRLISKRRRFRYFRRFGMIPTGRI